MERLTVGSPRITLSYRQSRSRSSNKPSPRQPVKQEPPQQKEPLTPQEPPAPPPEPVKKPEAPHRRPFELAKLSPSAPLFSLFNKDIYGEDLLLLLLILILIEENADKLLIGALIYVFLG